MSFQRVNQNITRFELMLWNEIKNILRYRSNELMAFTRTYFLSRKSGISVGGKSGKLANSGRVVDPYRRGMVIFGGVKYDARDPVTNYNYALSHFRNPGEPFDVIIRPKNKQALAIPIKGAGSTIGGTTFARGGLLFVRNSFDRFDFTPVAVLVREVTYKRRIDVETMLFPYIKPKIEADLQELIRRFRPE
jgi:hypothetical protein